SSCQLPAARRQPEQLSISLASRDWHSRRNAMQVGSVNELEYDLLLAKDLGFLPATHHARVTGQLEEVRRMLSSLVQTLTPWRRRTEPSWPLEAGSFGG